MASIFDVKNLYKTYGSTEVLMNISFGMKVRGVDQATLDAKLKQAAAQR